ncbi:MAG: hypothetical protein RL292_272 [Candidatus Parcubacteria bacterium]|jgi:hypothetical protein
MNKMNLSEMTWQGSDGVLAQARAKARKLKREGNFLPAHSLLLSTYISIGVSVSALKKVFYFFCAMWHAHVLYKCAAYLDHSQLDVLLGFYIGMYKRSALLFFLAGPPKQVILDLAQLQQRKMIAAISTIRPCEIALGNMTSAEVYRWFVPDADVYDNQQWMTYLGHALSMKRKVFEEEPRLQALRQWVRVLRRAGEVHADVNPSRAYELLKSALELAQGEANAPEQVKKILPLMHAFELEEENKK